MFNDVLRASKLLARVISLLPLLSVDVLCLLKELNFSTLSLNSWLLLLLEKEELELEDSSEVRLKMDKFLFSFLFSSLSCLFPSLRYLLAVFFALIFPPLVLR